MISRDTAKRNNEVEALGVLVYLENIYSCLLSVLIKPTIYANPENYMLVEI